MRVLSPVSVAPMIRRTDRHFRYLMRLISPTATLYTEMITAAAINHGDQQRLMAFHPNEKPVVIQLAGNDPQALAEASKSAEDMGYSAINLNVGCPSDRVQSGSFGVCLMKQPQLVADCLSAMQAAVSIPVSIKTRIGVDDLDSESYFMDFMGAVYASGCREWIVHARKAWLQGLSPKENRTVPPLHYDRVYRLKQHFPDCHVVINGGIEAVDAVKQHLQHVDGVMLGRALVQSPWLLHAIDESLGLPLGASDRMAVIEGFLAYAKAEKLALRMIVPHLMGLFYQQPNGKQWRRYITEHGAKQGAGLDVIRQALSVLSMDMV